jgi:glycosyltransferase involved in cell wall biosynthesis
MKILILNHEFPPIGGGGGVAASNIARQLVDLGHEVVVVTTGWGERVPEQMIDGVRVYRIPGARRSQLDSKVMATMFRYCTIGYWRASEVIRKWHPDILHAFFTVPAGWVAVRLGKKFRIPTVISLRGSDVPGHNPDEFSLQMNLLKPFIGRLWRKADSVVAVSKSLRDRAYQNMPDGFIDVVYNGVNLERFFPPHIPRNHVGPLRILTVSRLVKLKGIQFLIQALSRIGSAMKIDFMWRVVGDGNYRSQLESQAKTLGIENSSFLGGCPQESLLLHYNWAELFVLPSLAESFGIAFAEAMACGLPVIGTRVGGIPEFVRHGIDGLLVRPANTNAIFDALNTLVRKREEFEAIGKKARHHIEKNFNWRNAACSYAAHYTKLKHHF